MAINIDNIEYYNKNVLKALNNWDNYINSTVVGDKVTIRTGGYAAANLTNSYNNGNKACMYRSIDIEIKMDISQIYNYNNYVEVVLMGTYRNSNGDLLKSYQSLNITYLDSNITLGTVRIQRVLSMQNSDFINLEISVINHTKSDITLSKCVMKRSQDINSSQVGESIGFGITLSKVIGYIDGCQIFYDGEETPTNMWWMEDNLGVFNGINVDNERLIKFERKNEILLD